MNENDSPNPIRHNFKQSKLVFTKMGLSVKLVKSPNKSTIKPPKNHKKSSKTQKPLMSTKRFKSEIISISEECGQCAQPLDHSITEVDPRLEEPEKEVEESDDDVIIIEDNPIEEIKDNPKEVIEDKPIEVIEDNITEDLTLETKLRLIEDCFENKPMVSALKTIDEIKEELTSLGLTLDHQICEEDSDYEVVDDSNNTFEVESIYDTKKGSDKRTLYEVKWKNWSEDYNTWEPIVNLSKCRKLVNEFNVILGLNNNSEKMTSYRNYYKLKGIIEDIVEKKLHFDVMTTILLVFNDLSLKQYNYTKHFVTKLRSDLREKHLKDMDDIGKIVDTKRRVDRLNGHYNRLIDELYITKRFKNFDNFFEFFVKRKGVQSGLNRWEEEINGVIKTQNEGLPIKVENYIDCDIPPPSFEYISNCRTFDPNIIINNEPPLYCECNDCETQTSECCVASYQSPINYTKNGILKSSRNAIHECNKQCKCSQDCINRVVQKGRKHKLAIFRTDDGKGWGVRTLEPIHKGSYVMEYVGEIISVEEANRRGQIYDAEGRTYLFDLDFTPDETGKYTLDATQCGNVSHFVNHSCDPNLDTRVVWINNLDPFMPHIALFAVRNIKLNEELTFDYKINVHGITDTDSSQTDSINNSDKSFDSGIDGMTVDNKPLRVSCHCGAYNCRKYLF